MIAFIHGYGTNVSSFFQRPKDPVHKGFLFLQAEIAQQNAKGYDWSIPYSLSFWQAVNPFVQLQIYWRERSLVYDRTQQKILFEFLQDVKPTVIVCHSLGCDFLLETLGSFGMPTSLQQIIFLQADVDRNYFREHFHLQHRLTDQHIKLKNLFCPWDPTLIFSCLLHLTVRAGLTGFNTDKVVNQFWPARILPDLHTSCLKDMRTLGYVTKPDRMRRTSAPLPTLIYSLHAHTDIQ